MNRVYLTVSDVFNMAFATFKANALFLIVVTVLVGMIGGVASSPQQIFQMFLEPAIQKQEWGTVASMAGLMGVFGFIAFIVASFFEMNRIKILLNVYDGIPADYGDLFKNFDKFFNFLLGYLLYSLIVFAGFLLLIVPGIVWAIKYGFTTYLIVDQEMSPMEAIRASGEMTRGYKMDLFVMGLAMGGIMIIGFLACCVGALATTPIVNLMWTDCYRRLIPVEHVEETFIPAGY